MCNEASRGRRCAGVSSCSSSASPQRSLPSGFWRRSVKRVPPPRHLLYVRSRRGGHGVRGRAREEALTTAGGTHKHGRCCSSERPAAAMTSPGFEARYARQSESRRLLSCGVSVARGGSRPQNSTSWRASRRTMSGRPLGPRFRYFPTSVALRRGQARRGNNASATDAECAATHCKGRTRALQTGCRRHSCLLARRQPPPRPFTGAGGRSERLKGRRRRRLEQRHKNALETPSLYCTQKE